MTDQGFVVTVLFFAIFFAAFVLIYSLKEECSSDGHCGKGSECEGGRCVETHDPALNVLNPALNVLNPALNVLNPELNLFNPIIGPTHGRYSPVGPYFGPNKYTYV